MVAQENSNLGQFCQIENPPYPESCTVLSVKIPSLSVQETQYEKQGLSNCHLDSDTFIAEL